jgi:hypothetical protein
MIRLKEAQDGSRGGRERLERRARIEPATRGLGTDAQLEEAASDLRDL